MNSHWVGEGYVAGEYGAPRSHNPYNKDEEWDAWSDWDSGWQEATDQWQREIDKIKSSHGTGVETLVTCLFVLFLALIVITLAYEVLK